MWLDLWEIDLEIQLTRYCYPFTLSNNGSVETLPNNLLHCPNWGNEQHI